MPFVQCPSCKTESAGSLLVCPKCGSSLAGITRYEKIPLSAQEDPNSISLPTVKPLPSKSTSAVEESAVRAEKTLKSGAGWLYAVAGLSLLNSLLYRLEIKEFFIFGLGITAFFDTLSTAIGEEYPKASTIAGIVAILLVITIALIFLVLGYFTKQMRKWAIVIGLGFYGLDTLFMLFLNDWLGIVFHFWVFYSLVRALRAVSILKKIPSLNDSD